MSHHKQLESWQQAMILVEQIYQCTQSFPREELFGLTSQMRRAAISVPSNIAEGAARGGTKEYAYFLNIARGSLAELDTQLMIAQRLRFILPNHPVFEHIQLVGRLLTAQYKSIRDKL
ncbi:MAG: four helix bundle protein [Plesiomonas shigelloides]